MSAKPKKAKSPAKKEKAEPTEARSKTVWLRPKALAPFATITSRNGPDTMERMGRGFSMGELEGASMPRLLALRWDVPTDTRRRTVLGGNVETLKKWFSGAKKAEKTAKVEAEPRKAEPKKRAPKKE